MTDPYVPQHASSSPTTESGSTTDTLKSEGRRVADDAARGTKHVAGVAANEAASVADEAKHQARSLWDQTSSQLVVPGRRPEGHPGLLAAQPGRRALVHGRLGPPRLQRLGGAFQRPGRCRDRARAARCRLRPAHRVVAGRPRAVGRPRRGGLVRPAPPGRLPRPRRGGRSRRRPTDPRSYRRSGRRGVSAAASHGHARRARPVGRLRRRRHSRVVLGGPDRAALGGPHRRRHGRARLRPPASSSVLPTGGATPESGPAGQPADYPEDGR